MRLVRGLSVILLLLAVCTSCVTRPAVPTYYYTLDYQRRSEQQSLFQDVPFPVSVRIDDTQVSPAYARPQIVLRGLGPQFEYLSDRLWGTNLSEALPDILRQRVNAYGIFQQIQREVMRVEPDYRLRSTLNSIEYVRFEGTQQALLDIELTLWNVETGELVVSYRAERKEPIFGDDLAIFVAEVTSVLFDEIDSFLSQVVNYLSTGEPSLPRRHRRAEQEITDPEEREAGVLILPALIRSGGQPFYTIVAADGSEIDGRQFGETVSLPEGIYSVLFGSGPSAERMRIDDIEVVGRQRTVVEPTWASLAVNIIDTSRESLRLRYDIYDAATGSSVGGRLSRSAAFLPGRTVWILEPAKYKVVINNAPFNTLQDFVTVNLGPGTGEDLTIVVDSTDNSVQPSMVGAGNVTVGEEDDEASPISFVTSINGSVSFTADNEQGRDDYQQTYIVDSEVGTELVYEAGPLRYNLETLLAAGVNAVGNNPVQFASDELRVRNTVVYSLTDLYGVYGRADIETSIFGDQIIFEEPTGYVKRSDGALVDQVSEATSVRLSPPFLPVLLREGAGLNVNAVRAESAELSIRGGLGAAQAVRHNVFEPEGSEIIDGESYLTYSQVASSLQTGLEISAFGTLLLPFDTTFTSSVDVFVPFAENPMPAFQWENVVNVVLVDNVSVYYRFVLHNDSGSRDYLVQDHGVFLRLSYLLR